MARKPTTTNLHGVSLTTSDLNVPRWSPVENNLRSIDEWNEENVQNHRVVDIAFGDAENQDLSEFTLSSRVRWL
jgi:hypothetical protein